MWGVPDKGSASIQSDVQAILFSEYLGILASGIAGTDCVLSGGAVTQRGAGANMSVDVAKGSVLTNGVLKGFAAANKAVGAADATNPRIDLVVADSSGALQVRAGTAAASPKPPARTANDVVLAALWVPANDTTIQTEQIVDMRVLRSTGPIVLHQQSSNVSFDTTNAIQTYYTITIPNGLLTSGRTLRIRCGGYYIFNNGSPTFTLTIAIGGATAFADATAAASSDADAGAWSLELDINDRSGAQRCTGHFRLQTPGAKNAPTTGVAGDLAVVTSVNSPIHFVGAADFNAGDVAIDIKGTMSVSNANDSFTLTNATVEIL